MTQVKDVLTFWFEELSSKDWFNKNLDLDREMRRRFSEVHAKGACGELYTWRQEPEGRLAEIIVLDQFSRNIFRGTPAAFAYDAIALVLAQEALTHKTLELLPSQQKPFLIMPFMHSESLEIHKVAVELFSLPGLEKNLDFELRHKRIIEQFGRYPHRNKILGRESTEAERVFLEQPGSSF